jgi:gliding motility-associated-like protein
MIPNAFSPDGDGVNDTWVIPAVSHSSDFTLEIYDRWGNLVYDYDNAGHATPDWWDGRSNGRWNFQDGEPLPTGTYFYIIKLDNSNTTEPFSGWVYLSR